MKISITKLKEKAELARASRAYQVEALSIQFTEELVARMEIAELTRSALAQKIGISPARLTRVLRGDTNLTLKLMARIAEALDSEIEIQWTPAGCEPSRTRPTKPPKPESSKSKSPSILRGEAAAKLMAKELRA